MTDPKVPGFAAGQMVRDLALLTAAVPRATADETDDAYLTRLAADGKIVPATRAEITGGRFIELKTKATTSGAVLFVPFEDFERDPNKPYERPADFDTQKFLAELRAKVSQ